MLWTALFVAHETPPIRPPPINPRYKTAPIALYYRGRALTHSCLLGYQVPQSFADLPEELAVAGEGVDIGVGGVPVPPLD